MAGVVNEAVVNRAGTAAMDLRMRAPPGSSWCASLATGLLVQRAVVDSYLYRTQRSQEMRARFASFGILGRRTSDAFRRATGHFLRGDPRAEAATAGRY